VNKIQYNPKLKNLARNLRNNSTKAEIILWKYLKRKKLRGYDFHRQKPIENSIVDFFCNNLMLAIELDGYTHGFEEVLVKDEIKEKRKPFIRGASGWSSWYRENSPCTCNGW